MTIDEALAIQLIGREARPLRSSGRDLPSEIAAGRCISQEYLHLLGRLAECSALHDAHERSREIGKYDADELSPRVRNAACANPGPGERVTGLVPRPFLELSGWRLRHAV